MDKKVTLPARLMLSTEVLQEIHLQTGIRYAYPTGALVRQIDATELKGEATVETISAKLAEEVSLTGGVLVLEKKLPVADLEKLKAALTDADAGKRRVACYQLGRSASVRAIEPLFEALKDADESVRHHALRALHYVHSGTRYEPEVFPRGRVSALKAAGKLPAETLLGFLKKANDPAENEWVWAAELLAAGPVPEALDAAKPGAKHGYARTRRAFNAILESLSDADQAPPPIEEKRDAESAVEALKSLASEKADRRASAARVIALRPDIAAKPVLDALKAEKDAGVKGELLLCLGRKGGKEAWDVILAEAGGADYTTKLFAVRALSRCPDTRAVPLLVNVMTGQGFDGQQRFHAAVSLGMIASPEVVKTLSEYVAATDMPLSITGLALGYIATPETEEALLKCVRTKKDSLKHYAYTGLSRVGSKKAVEVMARNHNEYDNTARYCGHMAIRRVRAQEGIDTLVAAVDTGEGPKRLPGIAPHGLEECDDPRAADALIKCVATAGGRRLLFTIQALGRHGDPRCAGALIEVINTHKGEGARWWAMRALRWRWYWFRPDVKKAFAAHPVFKHFVEKHPSPQQQAENTWVCRKWPIDYDDYRCVNTSYEAGMVFDHRSGKVLKWGSHGQRCDAPQLGETWLYDVQENTWTDARPPVRPVGMCGTWGLSSDEHLGRVLSMRGFGGGHGWTWGRSKALRQSAPWVYDSEKNEWTPVRPADSPGSRGFTSLAYVRPVQVHVTCGGQGGKRSGRDNVWAYDMYSNSWHMLPLPEKRPGARAHETTLYVPSIDRVLMKGGSYGASKNDNGTWLYDLKKNAWQNARNDDPKKVPKFRKPVVYDPATGDVLAFITDTGRSAAVWRYSTEKNEWGRLPAAEGASPHHDSVDMCYDPGSNVFVIDGGHTDWETDHIAVREVWTYKHVQPPQASVPPPGRVTGLSVEVAGGKASLKWKEAPGASGYNVYRGVGKLPWEVKYEKVVQAPVKETSFSDPTALPADGKTMAFYYVVGLRADGSEAEPSFKVRTQPPIPGKLLVSVMPDRTVELAWQRSPAKDVVGYHVYATAVGPKTRLTTNCIEADAGWERLTKEPVKDPAFIDARKLAATEGVFGHEVCNYQVRAVNSLGVESGPSERGFTLTSPVPAPNAELRPDGSVLVTWRAAAEKGILGYNVYRLEEIRPSAAVRLTASPVKELRFVDRPETPRAERRRYYVVAVDALGQEGIPSFGAWAFGRP
ncbi:MAG: HEAT repeat domain-containing protein [Planctomycetota bacterium]